MKKEMELEELKGLTDDQIKNLINSGVRFRHKTLEERAAEFGGELGLDGEYDWGEPVGTEIW